MILSQSVSARRKILCASVSLFALALDAGVAYPQGVNVGTIEGSLAKPVAAPRRVARPAPVRRAGRPATRPVVASQPPANVAPALPISSDKSIGANAPVGSAPALALSQGSLNAKQPGSVISDKVLRDVILPSSDYNEAAKFTPGFYSSNANGPAGDTKGGWRGFQDGQYNITFDGVPFGDANNPSHHSAAYFPGAFLGSVIIDRGPGAASQVGYATFGGTMSLNSIELKDKFGYSIAGTVGNYGTYTGSVSMQSGLFNGDTRALLQYSHVQTLGALQYGTSRTDQFLAKIEKKGEDVTLTALATGGFEYYNQVKGITWGQLQAFGTNYGAVTNNPATQQFTGFNNSSKWTDMEYVDLAGNIMGWHFDNKAYTYAYVYPSLQNNAFDQTIESPASPTVTAFKVTNPPALCAKCTTTVTFTGVKADDVTGYQQINNYRGWGNILKIDRDINAGFASGQLRFGFWGEHVDNGRWQSYFDYTQGVPYASLGPVITAGGTTAAQNAIDINAAAFKLNLNSHITNYQPYIEYEWRPFDRLSITPGYKYEIFNRTHSAAVNQTTLMPASFDKTYRASLPFLAANFKVTPELSIYAQASKGFLAPTVSAFYVYDINSANIQPQSTTNYQAGVVFKNEMFTAAADVYQVTATNFPINTTLSTGEILYTNGGTARYRGIEAEGTFAFGKLMGSGFGNGLAAYASGALMEAKFIEGDNTGLMVGSAPRYTLAGGLIYDDGMFFGSALHKITGDQYGATGQQLSTVAVAGSLNKVAAYDSTDLVAGVRSDFLKKMGFGEKAEFKIGVANIFDHRSLTDASGTIKGLTPATGGLTYTFQSGRVIYGGLKVDF